MNMLEQASLLKKLLYYGSVELYSTGTWSLMPKQSEAKFPYKLQHLFVMAGLSAAGAAALTSCSRVSPSWRRPSSWPSWRPSGRVRTSCQPEASSSRWVSNPGFTYTEAMTQPSHRTFRKSSFIFFFLSLTRSYLQENSTSKSSCI